MRILRNLGPEVGQPDPTLPDLEQIQADWQQWLIEQNQKSGMN